MSDEYFQEGRTTNLAYWGLGQMMKGAGIAAACVIGFGLMFGVIYVISLLLPADSKTAPDPNTWDTSALVIEAPSNA